jgi:hypothetical protein
MKDLGVAVDRRLNTEHSSVYHRIQPSSSKIIISSTIAQATSPPVKQTSMSQALGPSEDHGIDMDSTEDREIRQLLDRLSIEEQVSDM